MIGTKTSRSRTRPKRSRACRLGSHLQWDLEWLEQRVLLAPLQMPPDVTLGLNLMGATRIEDGAAMLTIGEIGVEMLTVAIPQGVIPNAKITLGLAQGLALVELGSLDAPPTLSTSAGSLEDILQAASVGPDGSSATLDFGTITDTDSSGAPADVMTLVFDVVATNVAANQNGTFAVSTATMTYDGGSATASAAAMIVTPDLNLALSVDNPNPAPGDTVTFTLVLAHAPDSGAGGFNVNVTDALPAGASYVADSLETLSGQAPSTLGFSGGTIDAFYNAFPLGATSILTFQAQISPSATPLEASTNSASATYATLPGMPASGSSPYDPADSFPRTGNPSDPGGSLNNLATSASVAYTITPPPTLTTVTSSLNPSIYGQSVTLTATVVNTDSSEGGDDGDPTGSVAFYDGSTELGIGTNLGGSQSSSTSTFTISTLTAGTHSLTARYMPTGDFQSSTSATLIEIVNQAALTITADDQTKVYGNLLPALTASYSGFVNGDTSASLTTQPTLTTTATASSHVSGNPYSITASGAVDSNYTISYVAGTLIVTSATLTITADNQSMTYGGTLPALTATYTTLVNGDTPSAVTGLVLSTVPATSHAGSYAITASGATDPDYNITLVNGTLTIGQAALTITANNQSMTYGGMQPALTATYTTLVNGDTPSAISGLTLATVPATSHAAGSYAITASGAHRPDYNITLVNGTLTIGQAALTITANNQSMTYGGTQPALTATYTTLVNGDTPSAISGLELSTVPATSHAGSYAITASGATDPDYTITLVNGTLTIGKAALTITANNQSMTYGGTQPALTATYTTLVNGDTPSAIGGLVLSTVPASSHAGSYAITASGATDPDYNITLVNGTLTIGKAALTITANNQSMTYGGTQPALTATYTTLVNGDTPSAISGLELSTVPATSHAGSYAISASGATDPDYNITLVNGTLTIGQAGVDDHGQQPEHDLRRAAACAATATYTTLVNGDTPSRHQRAGAEHGAGHEPRGQLRHHRQRRHRPRLQHHAGHRHADDRQGQPHDQRRQQEHDLRRHAAGADGHLHHAGQRRHLQRHQRPDTRHGADHEPRR